jgi:hypothetical protein
MIRFSYLKYSSREVEGPALGNLGNLIDVRCQIRQSMDCSGR